MKTHLERLLRSAAWADRRSLAALRDAPAAQDEALPLLAHVLAAEHVWLSRLDGSQARFAPWPRLTLDECERLADENAAGYAAYLGRLGDDQLDAAVHYRNTKGEEFATAAIDILTHVFSHGAYHRGQVAKIIGRCGGTAVNTDFMMFAREVEPGPSSP